MIPCDDCNDGKAEGDVYIYCGRCDHLITERDIPKECWDEMRKDNLEV